MQKIYAIAAVLILVATLTIEWLNSEIFEAEKVADAALTHSELMIDSSATAMKTAKSLSKDLATGDRIQKQFELRTQVRDLRQRIANLKDCIRQEQSFLGTKQSTLTIENALSAGDDMARALDELAQISNTEKRAAAYQMVRFTVEPRLRNAMKDIIEIVHGDIENFANLLWWVRVAGTSTIVVILGSIWLLLIVPAERNRKRATDALETERAQATKLAEQANAANEAKTRFLSTMSHELRTPLNGVVGMAELVEPLVDDPEATEMIGTIKRSGEHLIKIVNEILDFSKIESGAMTIESAPFDIVRVLNEIKAAHWPVARKQGIALEFTSAGVSNPNRMGDSHRITQILNNLIGNSLKFTENGHVKVTASEGVSGDLLISVIDTGIGMSPKQLDVLFVDFVQADTSIARRFGGTGLGMSITKSLIEAMNGTIKVASRLGEGTEFEIRLPLEQVSKVQSAKPMPKQMSARYKNLSVLAVDDNKTNRLVLGKMLEKMGITATICENGPDAVQAAKDSEYDLFLFDISMPDMDGIQCLEAINWHKAELNQSPTPAIAVTANTLPEQIDKYLKSGFNNYLAKPVRSTALQMTINETIDAEELVA